MKLGSLFDGSGGFPLAGALAGITPVWASEIEPFPIRVTTKRLPDMHHCCNLVKKQENLKPLSKSLIRSGIEYLRSVKRIKMAEFIQVAIITLLTLALALAFALIATYFIMKIALYFAKKEDKGDE